MQTKFTKTLLAALPMAGLLFTAPAVFAHDDDYDDDRGNRHERYHDRQSNLHEEFHRQPYSEREHQGVYNNLRRDHRYFHGDNRDWSRQDGGWNWRDRNSNWNWQQRNNGRDWSWSRGRDNWRSRHDNNDCRPTPNSWWYR